MRGKSIVLVGPGRHFGVELVRKFASEGYSIGIVGTRPERLKSLELELLDLGTAVHYIVADVTQEDRFRVRLEALANELGEIEGLIYNPKFSVAGSALEVSSTDFNRALAVNVTGALIAIQTIIPYLSYSQRRCVILTGGGYKDQPHDQKFALSLGKALLHSLYEVLRPTLQQRGIQLKTVVIDGAVRRDGPPESSASAVADFYWDAFLARNRTAYRFPVPTKRTCEHQLRLAI